MSGLVRDLGQPSGEVPALGVGGHQFEGLMVGVCRRFGASEAAEQVRARGGQQMVAGQLPGRFERSTSSSPAAGPSAIATATARFSLTTGEATTSASSP